MAQEQRNGGVSRVREALDDCTVRMRRGDSLTSCLESYPGYADELRPMLEALLACAANLRGHRRRLPIFRAVVSVCSPPLR